MTIVDTCPIPGYPGYSATADGQIIGKTGRALSPHPLGIYQRVGVQRGGRPVHRMVHVLVALAFVGQCPPGHEVNHKDGDGSNNRWANLEYVTPSQNVVHAVAVLGRIRAPGETNGNARLSDRAVTAMRAAHRAGVSSAEVGRRFGVDATHAWRICTHRSWKHVA